MSNSHGKAFEKNDGYIATNTESKQKTVPSLDGLRGIAILMVMAVHTGGPLTASGTLGVDLFFTLSGFLITTLLLKEQMAKDSIDLKKFYIRRFLRLMPLYMLYVGGLTVLETSGITKIESHGGWDWRWHIASLWLYFVNYLPLGGFSYWNSISYHLWSLSVEEQFYIVWPISVVFLSRFRALLPVAWILVVYILIRIMTTNDFAPLMLHTDKRGFGIFFGSAVAITCFKHQASWIPFVIRNGSLLLNAALVGALLSLSFPLFGIPYNAKIVFKLFSLCFVVHSALAIAVLWYGGSSKLADLLTSKPLVFTGMISYGLYVWNPLAHYLTWKVLTISWDTWSQIPKFGGRVLIYAFLNYVLASISFYCYERLFLKLKDRFR